MGEFCASSVPPGCSFIAEGDQRIDLRSLPGGEKAGSESNSNNAGDNYAEGPGVGDRNTPELAGEKARQSDACKYTDDDARTDQIPLLMTICKMSLCRAPRAIRTPMS